MSSSKNDEMLVLTVVDVLDKKEKFTAKEVPGNDLEMANFPYEQVKRIVLSALEESLHEMRRQKKATLSIKFSL